MFKPKRDSSALRDLVKSLDEKVYDFCRWMIGTHSVDEMVLQIFREFGDLYRKDLKKPKYFDPIELKIRLFQRAWIEIEHSLTRSRYLSMEPLNGQHMKNLDFNFLELQMTNAKNDDLKLKTDELLKRVTWIDPELRATVILKDVIGMEDEEISRILGLRWGVYRHRLHRGRMEMKDCLRGMAYPTRGKEERVTT